MIFEVALGRLLVELEGESIAKTFLNYAERGDRD
jgi:hypothetical protein